MSRVPIFNEPRTMRSPPLTLALTATVALLLAVASAASALDTPASQLRCMQYNRSSDGSNCSHGIVLCADHPDAPSYPSDHFCQALYHRNDISGLFELFQQDCHFPVTAEACSAGSMCIVDTSTEYSVAQCCCDGPICNQNVSVTNASMVTGFDECRGHGCEHACYVTDGVPHCLCDDGYVFNDNGCTDIDECEVGLHDCAESATCVNTEGSFVCQCDVTSGMRLSNDSRSCHYAGLVCESLRCVGDVCAPRTVEYCLDHFAEFEPTLVELNFTCIAVSVMGWGSVTDQRSGGALIVTTRISSCSPITGWNCVDEDVCRLQRVDNTTGLIYQCCCTGNLCNSNTVFSGDTLSPNHVPDSPSPNIDSDTPAPFPSPTPSLCPSITPLPSVSTGSNCDGSTQHFFYVVLVLFCANLTLAGVLFSVGLLINYYIRLRLHKINKRDSTRPVTSGSSSSSSVNITQNGRSDDVSKVPIKKRAHV